MTNETLGRIHVALTFVGTHLTFLPMHHLGLQGMPRRVAMYDPQFTTINQLCTVGAFVLAASVIPFTINMIWSWLNGAKAGDNPWNARSRRSGHYSISKHVGVEMAEIYWHFVDNFFYKHNDAAALQIATQVIEQIAQLERLPDDWESLAPLLSHRKEEPNIRLYLNAYAASGLILARMGAIDQSKQITVRVSEIDALWKRIPDPRFPNRVEPIATLEKIWQQSIY